MVSQNVSSDWLTLTTKFEKTFKALNIPELQIAYVDNLHAIKDEEAITGQEQFFLSIKKELAQINIERLSKKEQLDYKIIKYETSLNLHRIELEKRWIGLEVESISDMGLSTIPMGKEWYAYYLKKWVDQEVSPDQLYNFGLKEIERVKSNIKTLQEKSGMDSLAFLNHINEETFFYKDVEEVQKAFENIHEKVLNKVDSLFPFMNEIPPITIDRGSNEALAQVPAFYNFVEQTFYYNYFDKPFNKRQIGWIYIHEAIPGHHYQLNLDSSLPRSSIAKMFRHPGYIEGYAAYIEELGNEIGAYNNIYDELGKWEWDIIRSVRVAIDVGLNYYAWSDEQAIQFWQKHITGQDDIAKREIARMKRWPAQVITYKYGADKILQWKAMAKQKSTFNLKVFHKSILEKGSLPFSILKSEINL